MKKKNPIEAVLSQHSQHERQNGLILDDMIRNRFSSRKATISLGPDNGNHNLK